MRETCKNCNYFLDRFLIKDCMGLEVKSIHVTDSGKIEVTHLNPWYSNEKGTGICKNEFSEFFEHCISYTNTCDCFLSKKQAQRDKSIKKEKDNFSVFDNYTCDGQLVMKFLDDKIEFIEE